MNWDQLQTILWLRCRLTRNQWTRSKGIGAVISVVISVTLCIMGVGSFVGGLAGGVFGLREATPFVIWVVWLAVTTGFLVFWLMGMLQELQRSESIDLQRLMHLPVALGQMFLVNYVASHLTPSLVIAVPAMIGLTIGLTISRGPAMVLMGPLAFAMVFMITAWTYCLRGWLAGLMSNPRKRRNVTMLIALVFILLSQGPNLYFNVFRQASGRAARNAAADPKRGKEMLSRFTAMQKFIPPLWVPLGAQALAEGKPLPALAGTIGCLVIGALGLRRAYRSTLRFYLGESGGGKLAARAKPARKAAAGAPGKTSISFLERQLPAVPEQAAALALATFRSLLRAPEVRIAWGTSFIIQVIAGATLLFRAMPNVPAIAKPFIATGAAAFSIFFLIQFFGNQFGFDRDAFRALILSPADRKLILLGKNLAGLPVGLGFGGSLLLLISLKLHFSPLIFLAGLLQLVMLLLLTGLGGNLLSILVPFRIQPGSMKPTKMPGLTMLVMVFFHMLFPLVMAPAFLPPLGAFLWQKLGWPAAVPVDLILSIPLTVLAALAYWFSLAPLGRLLQRRETKILSIVTVEVE